jgi:SAM-dependent methyltransferase
VSGPDRLEVLGTDLLERHAARAEEFHALSRELRIPLGWHYILDLVWVSTQVEELAGPGRRFLDAGAGNGLMQWWLANRGVEVISIDRIERSPSRRLRARYDIRPREGTSLPSLRVTGIRRLLHARTTSPRLRTAGGAIRDLLLGEPPTPVGPPVWYGTGDLAEPLVEPGSMDAVVGISSLEHNPPERLATIVQHLLGAIRSGGTFAVTVMGADETDWFHEPSQGWCLTEATLQRVFGLPSDAPSNYDRWQQLFAQLRESRQLRENLARFYFTGGSNGMPWGRWDPRYQPVGIVKRKRA